jgi:hypothetical protein
VKGPTLESYIIGIIFAILAVIAADSCIAPKGMGDRSYFEPDGVRQWQGVDCTVDMVADIYDKLYAGTATPGETMFYFRCRGPNEYKQFLKEIKRRETWWIKHHPRKVK